MNTEELPQAPPQLASQPFVVTLDDGAAYRVTRPDFTLLSTESVLIADPPGKSFAGCGYVICPVSHISRVILSKSRAKAGASQFLAGWL